MKTTGKLFRICAIALVGAAMFTGCQKEDKMGSNPHQSVRPIERLSADQEELVQSMIKNVSEVIIYDEELSRAYSFNTETRDFSFADAGDDGWNFSEGEEVQWFANENGGGVLVISISAFGANSSSGSGNVLAGTSLLSIDYTFCFSASDEALGLDLFDYGATLDGISMVLGIDGDFEALMDGNVDEEAEFTDFFHGFAMFYVFDDEAQGSYDVLDWFENSDGTPEDLSDNGFSYILDFINFSIYFSYSGEIDVTGGQMSFEGEYFGILDLLTSIENYEDIQFAIVDGWGDMGCN